MATAEVVVNLYRHTGQSLAGGKRSGFGTEGIPGGGEGTEGAAVLHRPPVYIGTHPIGKGWTEGGSCALAIGCRHAADDPPIAE